MKYALFVGEMLIDFIPSIIGPDGMPAYQPHPGGAVANAAVALARLGGAARFIGKLGSDSFGRLLLSVLRANAVDARFVVVTTKASTTLVLVTLQEGGQREFTFYRQGTADTQLKARELEREAWDEVALCHAGSVLLTSEPARSATLEALDLVRRLDGIASFDVNARPMLWKSEEDLRTQLTQVVTRVDLLKCSAEEAHYLDASIQSPLDPMDTHALSECAGHLLALGPKLVVITRGPLGALLATDQQQREVSAPPVEALDTTGAGDAFMGALLYRLLSLGHTTPERLAALTGPELHALGDFANRAAGLSCTRYGGIASLPYLSELEKG